jgi:hypothetical protein
MVELQGYLFPKLQLGNTYPQALDEHSLCGFRQRSGIKNDNANP